jgi:hypothetical protein
MVCFDAWALTGRTTHCFAPSVKTTYILEYALNMEGNSHEMSLICPLITIVLPYIISLDKYYVICMIRMFLFLIFVIF